ncbi:MAG: hypothetical protein KBT11_10560 [Treponema sp.]|nr:hypothetical protein [Candidatus Treponema equifaecale]
MRKGNIIFVRAEHKKNYTCISNRCLQDARLSLKARGLLVQLLSLPENWILYKSEVGKYNRDHKHAVNSAITELESLGYLLSRKKDGNIFYKIIEAPEGTVSLYEKIGSENQKCDDVFRNDEVVFKPGESRKSSSHEAGNQPLLNNNLNNIKLTTTKAVSQSLFSNEELRKSIEETNGYVFSEDFYSNLADLQNERGVNPLEYVNWLVDVKGKNAESVQNYVYKAASNQNVVNEYCRYKRNHEKQLQQLLRKEDPVVCPECSHTFKSIDFITRKCQCGLSLNEIMNRKGGCNE